MNFTNAVWLGYILILGPAAIAALHAQYTMSRDEWPIRCQKIFTITSILSIAYMLFAVLLGATLTN